LDKINERKVSEIKVQ